MPKSPPDLRLTIASTITLAAVVSASSSGCLDRPLKQLNPCLVSSVNAEVKVDGIDKVDLLFMVDNSSSMREEQIALSQQFKNIINVLTTGKRGGGKPDFTPAKDLHLAVVSSDLGAPGIPDLEHCSGTGDDGLMQNTGHGDGCQPQYPRFLSFHADSGSPEMTANDFACIAALGTDGCGFEQQLESTLKALWPSVDPMPRADGSSRVKFVSDVDGSHGLGHGDSDNAGFLRSDPDRGLSLLAIVLVTDEEDCSVLDPSVLAPAAYLRPDVPEEARLAGQGLNTRCALNPDRLFPTSRYVEAFKALRPGHEDLVVFAGIVGVPLETVDEAVLARTNFDDDAARDAFYQGILQHPAMNPVVDDLGTPDPSDDMMHTSCETATGKAYPPRRIVEVARGFGRNGIVQSICQGDFTPAVNAIMDLVVGHLTAVCLPRPLVRNAGGLVECDVVWELPEPGHERDGTPVRCDDPRFPFLLPPNQGEAQRNGHGGARCRVAQLAVAGGAGDMRAVPTTTDGTTFQDGWFYDTFTPQLHEDCDPLGTPQRVGFSAQANPPAGVTVKLECLNQTQRLPQQRADLADHPQPAIGDPCTDVERDGARVSADDACALELADGQRDTRMFCHAEDQICVLSCGGDADCPPAWVCDRRPESVAAAGGHTYCVNPTCGDTPGKSGVPTTDHLTNP